MKNIIIDGVIVASLTGIMAHKVGHYHKDRRIWYSRLDKIQCETCQRMMQPGELYSCKAGIFPECTKCWPIQIGILNAESYPGCLRILRAIKNREVWIGYTDNP